MLYSCIDMATVGVKGSSSSNQHLSFVEQHGELLLLTFHLRDLVVKLLRLVLCRLDLASQLRQLTMKRTFRHRLNHTTSHSHTLNIHDRRGHDGGASRPKFGADMPTANGQLD